MRREARRLGLGVRIERGKIEIGAGQDITRNLTSALLQFIAFPLQSLHFALERGFQIVRGAPEFGKCLTDGPPQFWKLLGPKQNEGDEEDNYHLLDTKRTHREPSLRCEAAEPLHK